MKRLMAVEQVNADPVTFTELRIHGVSGTPPETLLGTTEIVQVRGDEVAGFFRPRTPIDPTGNEALEAYSWGGLTSKSWTRALWVVLAPFALMNVAWWMLPERPATRRWTHDLATAAIRLFALHATLLVVIWTGQIAMEFAAFQCGGSATCRESHGMLRFLGAELFTDAPARRLVLGALVPVALILVLLWLSSLSRGRYEASYPFDDPRGERPPADQELVGTFADPTLWKRDASLKALAHLHVAAALAALAWLLAASTSWLYAQAGQATPAIVGAAAWAGPLLVAVAAALAAAHEACPDSDVETITAMRRRSDVTLTASAAMLALSAVAVWLWPAHDPGGLSDGGQRLAAYGDAAQRLTGLAFVVAGAFLVALILHPRRRASVPAPLGGGRVHLAFGGFGAVFAVMLGYLLAGLYMLSLSSAAARYLGGRSTIDAPPLYDAAAIVAVVLLAVVLPVALAAVWVRVSAALPLADLNRDFPGEDGGEAPELSAAPRARRRWLRSVRTLRVLRRCVTSVGWPVGATLVVGYLLLLSTVLPTFRTAPAEVVAATPAWLATAAVWAVSVGMPVAMFFVVRRSFVNPATRRRVGVLWDVLTFWPRWFHPFAPPSYAARAVPELRTRLDVLVGEGSAVVLSAHSQGSVIALAAIDGLRGLPADGRPGSPPICDRVALLTYGSPITRLYLRHFPAHLRGPIERVAAALSTPSGPDRWLNLYRATDPIGGAISGERALDDPTPNSSDPPDGLPSPPIINPIPDPDTRWVGLAGGGRFPRPGDPYPKAAGHSSYYAVRDPTPALKPEYTSALGWLRRSLTGAAAQRPPRSEATPS